MNQFKHAKWWRRYLDKLNQAFSYIKESQQKEKSKEKQREAKRNKEENRGQQLQSSLALLEHLPKSIFYILYTISNLRKSRIQRFKPCTIWSWNEERYGLRKTTASSWGTIAHTTVQGANSSAHCATISHTSNQRAKLELQRANFPLFLPTPHEIFSFRYFCINFHYSPCNPRIIRFLS